MSLLAEFQRLAARNRTEHPPFIGAGAYPHHVPPVVDQLLLRGEFFTAYTPYQPEIAQGTLQALFEWQTFVTLLTGLEVANASMYDGASATAEAVLMATRVDQPREGRGERRRSTPSTGRCSPPTWPRPATRLSPCPTARTGAPTWPPSTPRSTTGPPPWCVGYPNFFGVVDALPEAAAIAKRGGALAVSVTSEAVSLGLLQAPGALGADVAVGTLQSFGNGVSFGGPAPGFLAIREGLVRQMPGRVAGATVDRTGRRGFVLTLSTREQHIRREKATSNICTNAGPGGAGRHHPPLAARQGGLAHLARLNHARGRQLRDAMKKAGFGLRFSGPTFNEAAFEVGDAAGGGRPPGQEGHRRRRPALALVPRRSEDEGRAAQRRDRAPHPRAHRALRAVGEGIDMANPTGWKPSMEKSAAPGGDSQETGLMGATRGLAMEEPLVFEQGSPGRVGVSLPPLPAGADPAAEIPAALLRGEIAGMPEMGELEVVRHFTRLSQWNYGIDTGFYPLGSCTMKYNPKSSEALARLPGFAGRAPAAPRLHEPGGARAHVRAGAGPLRGGGLRPPRSCRPPPAPRASSSA